MQFALNEYCSWTRGYISNCSQIIKPRSFELFYKRKRLVNLVVTAFFALYFKQASGFFDTFQPGGRFFPSLISVSKKEEIGWPSCTNVHSGNYCLADFWQWYEIEISFTCQNLGILDSNIKPFCTLPSRHVFYFILLFHWL